MGVNMIELRKSPRSNVLWRAAIKLGEGNIVPAKVINVSASGLLIQCAHNVAIDKEYRLLMEVPRIDQSSSEPYQVACKISVLHAILSGDSYRIGVKFTEISDLHKNLVAAWLSITNKIDWLA